MVALELLESIKPENNEVERMGAMVLESLKPLMDNKTDDERILVVLAHSVATTCQLRLELNMLKDLLVEILEVKK